MTKFKKFLLYTLISLTALSLLRVSLYTIYNNDFSSLNFSETLLSFIMGARVDLITVWTLNSVVILLMFLPFKFSNNKIYSKILGYLWYLILILEILIILADILYFNFTHRHFGSEVNAMGNDMGFIVDMLVEYKYLVAIYLLIATTMFFIFRKLISIKISNENSSFRARVLLFLAVIVIVFLGIRSKMSGKPFGVSDAFAVNKTSSGNLALNGCFTLYRTISKGKKAYKFYNDKEALKVTKDLLKNKIFKFKNNKQYPLVRTLKNSKNSKKYNVVIILLESWSAKYIDSFTHNNLKVTPNFDKLAKNGLIFNNFYANGQRSIIGITALLSTIPTLKGISYLGKGLELSNISYLGNIFKENGYHTIAMQSSARRSFRVDSITQIAGFDNYYGAEDMPLVGDEDKSKKPRFGTWDGNMYSLLIKKLDKIEKPFLSFAFTSTTHPPFISPGKKWEVYPHNRKNILGYLNTLKYADDKLGQFMQQAKQKPWFNDTIFIFLADHTIGFGDESKLLTGTNIKIKNRALENMRIPLLIYAPKIFKPEQIDTIGSQADILPTLVDLLALKGNFTAMSNSLFSPNESQFALLAMGQTIGMVDKSGYIIHTLDKKLEQTGDKRLEKKLLSLYQTLTKLLRENRWFR